MVQHYEAIGGKTKILGTKPASVKVVTHTTDVGRYARRPAAHTPALSTGHSAISSSLPISDDASGNLKVHHHMFPNGFPRTSPTPRISPTDLPPTAPVGYPDTAGHALDVQNTKPSSDEASGSESPPYYTFPTGNVSSPANEPTKSSDERSPSPERPYQGVGRLIDQWQRKTAETDTSRGLGDGNRRGGFVMKRAGGMSREASRGR